MEDGGLMPECYVTKRGIRLSVTSRYIGGGGGGGGGGQDDNFFRYELCEWSLYSILLYYMTSLICCIIKAGMGITHWL